MRRVMVAAVAAAALVSGAQMALAEPDPDGGFCIIVEDLPAPLPRSLCIGHGVDPICVGSDRNRICIPPE